MDVIPSLIFIYRVPRDKVVEINSLRDLNTKYNMYNLENQVLIAISFKMIVNTLQSISKPYEANVYIGRYDN